MSAPAFPSNSLYVGDLHPDVTEGTLFEIFNPIGTVSSIRVCRDVVTRRSLGYAYVNFHNPSDANNAVEQLNNTHIKGKPCRIMWSQRDPGQRKSGKGNIFIKNLSKDIDNKTLFDTFSKFGNILSCKIELDEKNQSKGYGYIQYSTSEEADLAIENVNGMMIADKKVFVGPFVPKKERQSSNESSFTNVFIKNLPENFGDKELFELFRPFGEIKSAVVMRDEKGSSKFFGFINFDNPDDAHEAVTQLNNQEINGKSIFVGRAQKKNEREFELKTKFEQMQLQKYQGVNLYIKNLDDDIDDEKLLNLFSPFGTITSAKIMRDSKGISKGFGFVCYSASDEASKAVQEMNGKIIGSKPLYVGLAQRKEERKAQLEATFSQMSKGIPPRGIPVPFYANGTPMFLQPGGQPLMYPQMMPRGRFSPGPVQAIPGNYVVIPPGRGQMKGRGMAVPGRRGPPPPKQMMPQIPQVAPNGSAEPTLIPPVVMPESQPRGVSLEEQKRQLGERLYSLIEKMQPELSGKITGMILESSSLEELLLLIEHPESLNSKVDEALSVLEEYGVIQKGEKATTTA